MIEDAAHAIGCSYHGRVLGTIGNLGCLSFDGQKNVTSGEGGALLVGDERLASRALNVQGKGTNRSEFLRGEVDHYEWTELGSSLMPSELTAAFLAAQLEGSGGDQRPSPPHLGSLSLVGLEGLQSANHLRLPTVPDGVASTTGICSMSCSRRPGDGRAACRPSSARGIEANWHYIPLHSSAAGRRLGRVAGPMTVTDAAAESLIRLPIHMALSDDDVAYVIDAMRDALDG